MHVYKVIHQACSPQIFPLIMKLFKFSVIYLLDNFSENIGISGLKFKQVVFEVQNYGFGRYGA